MIGQAATALVVAHEGVVASQADEPVPPHRALPVVVEMGDPVCGAHQRRARPDRCVGQPGAICGAAETDLLAKVGRHWKRRPLCCCGLLDGCDEAIATTVHRLHDPLIPSVVAEGLAQLLDACGQRRLRHELMTPDGIEQLGLGHHRVAVLHEVGQHVEHLWLDVHQLTPMHQLVTSRVENAVGELVAHHQIVPFRRGVLAPNSASTLLHNLSTWSPSNVARLSVRSSTKSTYQGEAMTTIENPIRNGVDIATLFATLDAVKGNPEIAKFQFRATNNWISGTHNQSTIHGFFGAMQEMNTACRSPTTPTTRPCSSARTTPRRPVEFLLHALAACLTAGIANIAAARGVNAHRSRVDRRGRHRPARHPRPVATTSATATSRSGSASRCGATTPRSCARSSSSRRQRSAVFDVITNGVPVAIEVDAG